MNAENSMPFPRISRDPAVTGGRACTRGLRVTLGVIRGGRGDGVAVDDLLSADPYLKRDDVSEAIRYGAWLAQEREITLAPVA